MLVVGEPTQGVERVRRRDPASAKHLDRWLRALASNYTERILPVDERIAQLWGRLNVPDPLLTIDGLLAATAIAHGLTLVTRNTSDVDRSGVASLNPFSDAVPPTARRHRGRDEGKLASSERPDDPEDETADGQDGSQTA